MKEVEFGLYPESFFQNNQLMNIHVSNLFGYYNTTKINDTRSFVHEVLISIHRT